MKPDFSDPHIAQPLLDEIVPLAEGVGEVSFMEVCGTHTMEIGRFGIRRLLPENIRLISGPGCPVCVTPGQYIDNAVETAKKHDLTVATYGDMVRVPGNETSLEKARAEGVRIKVITSPLDILNMEGDVLFLAVGFETTAAPIAAVLDRVIEQKRSDISFYTSIKLVPPTLKVLGTDPDIRLDGFLLPGHVSAVIGTDAYGSLGIPAWIAGFEMTDVLRAVKGLLEMITAGTAETVNGYSRAVTSQGNRKAVELFEKYFTPSDELWRGIGELPGCSLSIRSEFSEYNAVDTYGIPKCEAGNMPEGCSCGAVLKGVKTPDECPLFAGACTPDSPVGPCMVSSEGSCAAYYKYERSPA